MINFILGIILGLIFASSYIVVYNIGKKKNKKSLVEEIDKEEKEKYKKMQEGFNNMMNYSVDIALGKGDR